MARLKELREEGAALAVKINGFSDLVTKEKRALTPEERTNFEQLNKDYDNVKAQVEILSRAETVATDQTSTTATATANPARQDTDHRSTATELGKRNVHELRGLAMQGWLRRDVGLPLTDDQADACRSLKINPELRSFAVPMLDTTSAQRLYRAWRAGPPQSGEQRAMSATNLVTGGAWVPEGFMQKLEVALLAYGGILQAATPLRTDAGNPLPMPCLNDTTVKATLIGENVAQTAPTDPATSQVTLTSYEYTTGPIKIPQTLIEDSAFNVEATVAEIAGIRIGRKLADHLTTGTGNGQPNGIIPAATSYSASTTAIVADDIIKLIHQIDPAYRAAGCSFMMHDSILLLCRLLKDGIGRYLWSSGLAGGMPDNISGYPVIMNQSMDTATSSGKKSMVFGLLSKYIVRTVRDMQLYRLDQLYRESNQIGFIGISRVDGNLLDAGTHPVKYLSH